MKNIIKYSLMLLGAILMAASCTINDGDERPVEVTPKLGTATLNVVMAVTTADDLGIDGVDVWADEIIAGSKMRPGDIVSLEYEFPQGSLFRSVFGGTSPRYLDNPIADVHNILTYATAAEMLPEDHNEPLRGQLKDGGSYTLIDYGFGALNHDYEHFFMVEDDLTPPASGMAKVRFLNAGGGECWDNTCELSFQVGGNDLGTGIWGGDLFGDGLTSFTDFSELSPGTINVDVYDGDAALYFSGSVDVAAGGIYTVVFFGNEADPVAYPEPNKFEVITHL